MSDFPQRIPYGDEHEEQVGDGPLLFSPADEETCPDCGVPRGEFHTPGCDQEQCPICSRQLIGCHFGQVIPDDHLRDEG